MSDEKCPRCLGSLYDDITQQGTPYRSEGGEAICGDCCVDETYRHALGAEFVPPSRWPILEGPHDFFESHELDPEKPF